MMIDDDERTQNCTVLHNLLPLIYIWAWVQPQLTHAHIEDWSYSQSTQWRLIAQADLIVCVEVLRPSQPYGVMWSVVSLPNHFYWAGLVLQAVNQYCAHSFPKNCQLPFLNQQKG